MIGSENKRKVSFHSNIPLGSSRIMARNGNEDLYHGDVYVDELH